MRKIKLLLSAALVLLFVSSCAPIRHAVRVRPHKAKVERTNKKREPKPKKQESSRYKAGSSSSSNRSSSTSSSNSR